MSDIYTHGHHQSVLRSHTWRTAENSAGYLLGHLRPGLNLLDVGCGPGTITLDLAQRVAPGRVVGIDASADVIAQAARSAADRGDRTTEFRVDDVYRLQVEDAYFDVVHAHQVLQHLRHPVEALEEIGRVLKPGGLLAVRDSDYGAFVWSPASERLDRWMQLYHQVTQRNQAEADAGRYLPGWVRQAGFADVEVSSSTWTFADPDTRRWWGDLWAERIEQSSLAEQAIDYGLSNRAELADISTGWRRWAQADDGLFVAVHVEVLARRPT